MVTLKQKIAFKKTLESLKSGHPKTKGKILLESGFSKAVSERPSQVYNSRAFEIMLAKIDDSKIVERWYDWATTDGDKRVALEAGDKIMKLKNRYPRETIDIELRAKREELFEPDIIKAEVIENGTNQRLETPGNDRLETDGTPAENTGCQQPEA